MKKILEIGGGRTPYFIRYNIPLIGDEDYTAVDLSIENISFAEDKIKSYKEQGYTLPKNTKIILNDATNLEFENNSFDHIIISNTLSAPIHRDWDRDGNILKIKTKDGEIKRPILKENKDDDPFYIERKNLIKEANRLLKKGGKISIYTDLIIYGIDSYQRILKDLQQSSIYDYEKDFKEEIRIDSLNKEKLKSKDFCCCFRDEVLPKW
jgi:ubiquinone/menaquinone biosynthesis C-methylase UbiE